MTSLFLFIYLRLIPDHKQTINTDMSDLNINNIELFKLYMLICALKGTVFVIQSDPPHKERLAHFTEDPGSLNLINDVEDYVVFLACKRVEFVNFSIISLLQETRKYFL